MRFLFEASTLGVSLLCVVVVVDPPASAEGPVSEFVDPAASAEGPGVGLD